VPAGRVGRAPARYVVRMRRIAIACLALGGCLLAAPPALAQQNKILDDYRDDGQINPCSYSRGQLQKGLKGLPPDVEQYTGLGDQLRRPCNRAVPASPTAPDDPRREAVLPTATGGPPNRPDIPRPPAPNARERAALAAAAPAVSARPTGVDVPGWVLVLIGLALVGGLGTLLAVRFAGLDLERVTRPWRAALAEGGDRATDALGGLLPRR
jgi:hypothetical protein